MTTLSLALRLAAAQLVLQAVLHLFARGLGRRLRWEIVALGLLLPWLVLAPWLGGEVLLAPTAALTGIPGAPALEGTDPHAAEQNDAVFQFLPWELEVRHAFAARRLPLWSDLLDGGSSPWLNPQAGVLSPIAMLARAVPIQYHLLAALLLKMTVVVPGTWLLARAAGARRRGAWFAAASAALCGGVFAWALFAHSAATAWVPWLAAGVAALFRRQPRRLVATVAVLTATLLLSGQPEVALAGGVFAGVCGWAWRKRGGEVRSFSAAALAAALGFSLAAPLLVPFAFSLPDSLRAGEHLAGPAPLREMDPRRPASWFHDYKGGFFASVANPHAHGRPFRETFSGPIAWTLAETPYAGLLAFAGVLVAVACRLRMARVLVWFSGVVLVLATGFIPVQAVLHRVPLLRLPEYGRFLPVLAVAVAVAGGLGVDALLRAAPRQRWRALLALAVAAAVSLWVRWDPEVIAVWVAVGVAAISVTLARRSVSRRVAAAVATALMAIALLVDMVPWARSLLPRGSADLFYPETPEIAILRATAPAPARVTGHDYLAYPSVLPVYGLGEVRSHNPLARADALQMLSAAFGYAPDNDPYFSPMANLGHPLLSFLGVRAVVSNRDLPRIPGLRPLAEPSGLWRIYSNDQALPRAFWATASEVLPRAGIPGWVAAMRDPRRVALLTEEAPHAALGERPWQADAVEILSLEPGDVRLRVATGGRDSLLATSFQDPDGWRVLAGPEATRLRTQTVNGAYLGAVVPAAVSEVTLLYRPVGFQAGAALAVLALLGLALLLRPAPTRPGATWRQETAPGDNPGP
jgi:hypothetical protein